MIVKEIVIDSKPIKFAASASIPRIYRKRYQRDIILDLNKIAEDLKEYGDEDGASHIPPETIDIFEDVAYIMAKHANKEIPDDVYEWLDDFNTFSIYEVLPELLDLWKLNTQTMSVPKKNNEKQ